MSDAAAIARDLRAEVLKSLISTGTWASDPELVGSGTAGTFTYSTDSGGEYTRFGNWVLVSGRCRATGTTVAPTGNLSITNLPFTAEAGASVIAGGCTFIQWNFNVAAGYTQVEGQILNGTTSISIIRSGDNVAPAVVQGSEALTAFDLQFWGVYRVAG